MITEEQLTELGFIEIRKYDEPLTRWGSTKFPGLDFDYRKDTGTLITVFGGGLLDITELIDLQRMIALESEWLHKLRRKKHDKV